MSIKNMSERWAIGVDACLDRKDQTRMKKVKLLMLKGKLHNKKG